MVSDPQSVAFLQQNETKHPLPIQGHCLTSRVAVNLGNVLLKQGSKMKGYEFWQNTFQIIN